MLAEVLATCLLIISSQAASISDDQDTCRAAAEQVGVDFENFRYNVAHVIHSLTVEDVRYFFDENFPVENNIPTANMNMSGPSVLLQTPSYPSKFKFPLGSTLDRILLNNDDPDNFNERGFNALEELGHAAHMLEMLNSVSHVYKQLENIDINAVCPCVVDDIANGIIEELEFKAEVSHIQIDNTRTAEEQDLKVANFCAKPEPRKGRRMMATCMNQRRGRSILVCPDVPEVKDSGTWKIFQHVCGHVPGAEKMATNAAIYFYCKITMMSE